MTYSDVVMDKSFLHGAPKDSLDYLFRSHRVLMTEALFYELLTTERSERARCFKRLPAIENPVVLVQGVGPILKWEVDNRQPILGIDNVAINVRYQFNRGLVNEDFQMAGEQTNDLAEWRKSNRRYVQHFADNSKMVYLRFPQFQGYMPGTDEREIENMKRRICSDQDLIREIYANGKKDHSWPAKDEIDDKWAIYRWLQIRLLASLDYLRKYGDKPMTADTKNIENEYMDLEYCLVGCIVGGIATRDEGMTDRFETLCPSGILIT